MMTKIFLNLFLVLNFFFQEKTADKAIFDWTKNYYKTSPYVKSNKDLHIFLIERISTKSHGFSIYKAGINVSGTPDMILIYKKSLTGKNYFKIIGDTDINDSLNKMYNFFEQNKAFSYKTRAACYERLILNEQHKHDYIK